MNLADAIGYAILVVSLFVTETYYFRLADRFSILDKPNQRSSHVKPVVRGGGIIFIVALLFWFLWEEMQWPWFMLGITAAGLISFADDIKSQPASLRFVIHFIATILMFYTVGLFDWPVWLWGLALIISIGALNAFNFMDGINGITGCYALITLLTFLYINNSIAEFTSRSFLIVNICSVLVFLFYNFRKKARCFAGDVGSVTIAFVLIFLLLQLIFCTGNLLWVILFLVYGIDSVVTIIYRLQRKENIFQPHRTHLYQYLSNELGWQHRVVSLTYATVQLAINAVLIYSISREQTMLAVGVGLLALVFYLLIRETVLRKVRV